MVIYRGYVKLPEGIFNYIVPSILTKNPHGIHLVPSLSCPQRNGTPPHHRSVSGAERVVGGTMERSSQLGATEFTQQDFGAR